MAGADVPAQFGQPFFLGFAGDGDSYPYVVERGVEMDSLGSFRKEQTVVLRVAVDVGEYLGNPFGTPVGEIAHAGEQKIVRTRGFESSQLVRHVLGGGKIGGHVVAAAVVVGIAVTAPDGTPDDDIQILDKRFDTLAHDVSIYEELLSMTKVGKGERLFYALTR